VSLLIKIKECDLKISITQLNETDVTNELLKSAKNQNNVGHKLITH